MSDAPLIRMSGIRRAFPGVQAVDGVDFYLAAGEIVGLVGKNGAGKSTLLKILAGIVAPDEGEIAIDGTPVHLPYGPVDAGRMGIAVVHQELEIVPGLSVAENVAVGAGFPRRRLSGAVDWRALRKAAREIIDDLHPGIDPATAAGELSLAQQRLVMIARAIYRRARVVILDEPSAALNDEEITQLHGVVRRLAERGCAVVYVSHRLQEILDLTERTVVMRDAHVVDERATAEFTHAALVEAITGHEGFDATVTRPAAAALGDPVLEVEGLTRSGSVEDVSFTLHRGEVLGLAGLVGAGRTELARLIAGADRADRGVVRVRGRETRLRTPRDAVQAGIALVPEDRRNEGLLTQASVRFNVTLATLPKYRRGRLPVPSRGRERQAVATEVERLAISPGDPERTVSQLSGGNLQKVVIAKWLERDSEILIFDEPTQGIDVEAKAKALGMARALAARGGAVLLIASDFSELVSTCDRVLVLREGRLVGELSGEEVSDRRIVELCYRDQAEPASEHQRLSNKKGTP
ncbi:MAG: sugar ABC transporter ATP-binding protein [Actinobacteria bacterium]|nr:sugar ABC transporter ATP-binding protein [Actinomycetota bacterium]